MTTYLDSVQAMGATLRTFTVLPVLGQNTIQGDGPEDGFLLWRTRWAKEIQTSRGGPIATFSGVCLLVIEIFVPVGIGDKDVWGYVETIAALFRGKDFGPLWAKEIQPIPLSDEEQSKKYPNFYQFNLHVSFDRHSDHDTTS